MGIGWNRGMGNLYRPSKIHGANDVRQIDRAWENVLYFRPNGGFVLM